MSALAAARQAPEMLSLAIARTCTLEAKKKMIFPGAIRLFT
jgi:hypothetical protein